MTSDHTQKASWQMVLAVDVLIYNSVDDFIKATDRHDTGNMAGRFLVASAMETTT